MISNKLILGKVITMGLLALTIGSIAFMALNIDPEPRSLRHALKPVSRRLQATVDSTKIAWVWSFPESGTTYFMHSVHIMSQKSTATNYGTAMIDEKGQVFTPFSDSVPIYTHKPGPSFATTLDGPSNYILTRTHSAGTCFECPPYKYLGPSAKLKHMHTNFYATNIVNDEENIVKYDRSLVDKMVILVRDPMDNVVSRFFQKVVKEVNDGNTDFGQKYPKNKYGFAQYCEDIDHNQFQDKELNWYSQYDFFEEAKFVPCRSEFVKIFQFYNMGRQVGANYKLDMKTINFENLSTDLEGTMSDIFQFVQLTREGTDLPHSLTEGDGLYLHFFTQPQRIAVAKLAKKMCQPAVWAAFAPYLEKYLQQ